MKKNINYKKRNENITGWVFISPLLIGLSLFLLFPLLFAIFVSFTDYTMYSPHSFFEFKFQMIGFDNYIKAFNDELFLRSLYNAFINCIGVPIGIVLAIFFTNLLIRNPKGSLFFRTLFYLPTICGAVIITFIWKWIFTLIPYAIRNTTGENINLLTGDNFLRSMIIMGVWSGIGTSILLLYSAMKGVDKSLYESAQIDGANSFNQLIHITIPAISPVAFYILLTGISGSLQDFSRFKVMGGSPAEYSIVPVWYIYQQVQSADNLAYGCTLGIILGLMIILLSIIQFVISKLWVHYE